MKILKFISLFFILLFMNASTSAEPNRHAPITPLDFVMGKFDPSANPDVMGKFDHSANPDFVKISSKHADRAGLYLQREAYQKFKEMYEAAMRDGIQLKIRSATRNFNYQKDIWERKWTGQTRVGGQNLAKSIADPTRRAKKILRYSSMPGSSRHHWGTDIDLNSFENSWFASGKGLALYKWLQNNASRYGFCQVYTNKVKDRRSGYEEEKWHWSYIPLASGYTEFARLHLKATDFSGFKGAKAAGKVDIVGKYVLGIARNCH